MVALAIVLIRLGCFLNGCCFGKVSALPWAVEFPEGSWVFWYHYTEGLVARGSGRSLSVHPLQLYFVAAGVTTFVCLLWYQRRPRLPGSAQMLFYSLFFTTTAVLEPFRENYLTLNRWLAPALAVSSGALLLKWGLSKWRLLPEDMALSPASSAGTRRTVES